MGIKNTKGGYGWGTKFFHWSVAVLFLFQFISIVAFRYLEEVPTDFTWKVLNGHKTAGLIILILGVLRIAWRKGVPLPDWPKNFEEWDIKISHFAEWGLYACIFLMTISGLLVEFLGGYYVKFFGLFYIDNLSPFIHGGDVSYAKDLVEARKSNGSVFLHNVFVAVHVLGAYGVLVFITAHLTHVFRHQVILKDGLLDRMLPGSGAGAQDDR